jgi:hypothetical protein
VHSSGVADDKFIHQIRDTIGRTLLLAVCSGDTIRFEPFDVLVLLQSMGKYIDNLIDILETRIMEFPQQPLY